MAEAATVASNAQMPTTNDRTLVFIHITMNECEVRRGDAGRKVPTASPRRENRITLHYWFGTHGAMDAGAEPVCGSGLVHQSRLLLHA
jgi:hypothetical protein